MPIYNSDKTGSEIDSLLDLTNSKLSPVVGSFVWNDNGTGLIAADAVTIVQNADAGSIGKTVNEILPNLNLSTSEVKAGFYSTNTGATGAPTTNFQGVIQSNIFNASNALQMSFDKGGLRAFFRTLETTWNDWREIYHTGNTGVTSYGALPVAGTVFTNFSNIDSRINIGTGNTAIRDCLNFYNPNGLVGTVQTNGTATAYNTSSDPRLKDFKEAPSDDVINEKFESLFDAFAVFNWKNDPVGDLVWGFDAHKAIDNGLDMGSEGEGPRDLEIGEVYYREDAVTEQQVKKDEDGNPTDEIETVVIKEAIEKKVSPAGVDQSKAVPILLAKIEQLERRIQTLEA